MWSFLSFVVLPDDGDTARHDHNREEEKRAQRQGWADEPERDASERYPSAHEGDDEDEQARPRFHCRCYKIDDGLQFTAEVAFMRAGNAVDEVTCSFTIGAGAFFEVTGILNAR
jgi:hypothetical protein